MVEYEGRWEDELGKRAWMKRDGTGLVGVGPLGAALCSVYFIINK